MPVTPDAIFSKASSMGASDVHVAVGSPIMFRIDGDLEEASKSAVSAKQATEIIKRVLGEKQFKRFAEELEIDVSYAVNDDLRLRVNCHFERGFPSMVARIISQDIPTMEEMGLIGVTDDFCDLHDGLILFTGPTGAGKSTSMASMIQEIRQRRSVHIITLEDPIEFIYPKDDDSEGLVRQRQFGEDFTSFPEAMKRVLRQDPDIVLVGEMRDLETISAALTLAETGHLVFGTLHTTNAIQTIDRIVDVFPPHQQPQIRSQLSLSMRLIVAQRLLKKEEGGRVALREVMVNTKAIANIIRENRIPELVSAMQMASKDGMITMEKALKQLYEDKEISKDVYEDSLDLIDSEMEDHKK